MSRPESKLTASLAELRRRKVFRVGAGYAVAAFAFLQLVTSVAGALDIGVATQRIIIFATLGGFPLALLLAWAYDLTPQGIERTAARPGSRSSRWLEFAIIGVLTLAVGGIGWAIHSTGTAPNAAPAAPAALADKSIAVLPFVNLSGDPANDYFGDGLAEELLNVLAQVPNLRVAARTSSFAYKGRNEDVRRIGNELNVATVLEGSVRKSGNKVRVTVQLISASDGYHLWSEDYDRTLDDIFTIQDDIARAITDSLKVTLLGKPANAASLGGTAMVGAYDQYLLGRHRMQERTEAGLLASVDDFEKSLKLDPNYARAWSGLADAYILLIGYGNLTPGKALPQAEAAAQKALAIDPNLAEAHASLGLIRGSQNREQDAVAEFETALKLDPKYAPAHMWFGSTLGGLQRRAEELSQFERAVELDPTLGPANSNLAGVYYDRGRYREGIELFERVVRQQPEHASWVQTRIGEGLCDLGAAVECIDALHRALKTDPTNVDAQAELAIAYLLLGDPATAQRWADLAWQRDPRVTRSVQARAAVGFAKRDAAAALAPFDAVAQQGGALAHDPELASWRLVVLLAFGRPEAPAALDQLQKLLGKYKATPDSIVFGPWAAWGLRRTGHEADAQAALDETVRFVEQRSAEGFQRPDWLYAAAEAQALAGHRAEALGYLQQALQRGWLRVWFTRDDPLLATLRDDPTYAALLKTMDATIAKQREQLAKAPPPEFTPPPAPAAVAVLPADLDRLTGVFLWSSNDGSLGVIARDGDALTVANADDPPRKLVATGPLRFVEADGSRSFEFVLGPDGRATHALVHWLGDQWRLKRVDFELPVAGRADPRKYGDYLGRYRLNPATVLVVTREGDKVFGKPGDGPRIELVPERDDVFFIPGQALHLSFVRDAGGKVAALRVKQVDVEIDAPREP